MTGKAPLEIRGNKIPENIDWNLVSEVHVWGWCDPATEKFLTGALAENKKAIRRMDPDAQASAEEAVSVDER